MKVKTKVNQKMTVITFERRVPHGLTIPEVCPTWADYDRFKQWWNEERNKLKAVREKLESGKRKRSAAKKIICIKKLPVTMTLPEVKEAMMLHISNPAMDGK